MITNKHINKIVVGIVIAALVAVGVLTYYVRQDNSDGKYSVSLAYQDAIFNTDAPMEINIIMDDDDWNDMLENAINEEYYEADVIINGTRINNVGIRPKGNTSLSSIVSDPDTDRYSFKIEFDKYVDGQTYLGLDKLILNNNYADATNMKEAIIYDMYKYLDADASLYNYASISVNNSYWGVYFALEAVEDSFLLRNYGTTDGELYKPESMGMGQGGNDVENGKGFQGGESINGQMQRGPFPGNEGSSNSSTDANSNSASSQESTTNNSTDSTTTNKGNRMDFGNAGGIGFGGMSGGGSNLNYSDDDLDSYSTIWDGEVTKTSDKDHERVVEALKNISEQNDLETYLDVDNVLKYMAVHTFAVNLDSLSGNMAHNYYLYENDGQLNMIPWDYNLSFGGMSNGMGNGRGNGDGNPFDMGNFTGNTTNNDITEKDTGTEDKSIDSVVDKVVSTSTDTATEMINFPIDTPFQSTNFFDGLLENEEYAAKYHEYLNQLLEEYVDGGKFDETYNRIRTQIDELVKEDPTAFYNYEEYDAAAKMLYTTVELRSESIKGQLAGTIPSTEDGQSQDSSTLIDGSSIDISVMGQMNMGGGGMNFGNAKTNDTTQSSSDTTGDNSSSTGDGQNGSVTPPSTGDGQNGSFTPPSTGDGQNGSFTPPSTGDGQNGSVTPPSSGDSQNGNPTFPNMGDSQEGMSFPDMTNGFPGMNSSSKETISDNLIWYGVSAVVLIGGLVFAITYKRRRRL